MSFIPKNDVTSDRKLAEFAAHDANSAERWWQAVKSKDETSLKQLNDHIEGVLKTLKITERFDPSYIDYLGGFIAACYRGVDLENMTAKEREDHREFTFGTILACWLNCHEDESGYCFVL